MLNPDYNLPSALVWIFPIQVRMKLGKNLQSTVRRSRERRVAGSAAARRKEALKANAANVFDDNWDNMSFVASKFGDDDLESRFGDVDDPDL